MTITIPAARFARKFTGPGPVIHAVLREHGLPAMFDPNGDPYNQGTVHLVLGKGAFFRTTCRRAASGDWNIPLSAEVLVL